MTDKANWDEVLRLAEQFGKTYLMLPNGDVVDRRRWEASGRKTSTEIREGLKVHKCLLPWIGSNG